MVRIWGKSSALGSVVAFFLAFPVHSQPPAPNYEVLRGQMQIVEKVLDEAMLQTVPPPFGLLEKTKGTYLAGYGVVFTLQVSLYPFARANPFAIRPQTPEEIEKARKLKRKRIDAIKAALPRLLADHAGGLREVPAENSVAVVVHFFNIPAEGENVPDQLVVQVKKSDLLSYQEGKLTHEELARRARTVEF